MLTLLLGIFSVFLFIWVFLDDFVSLKPPCKRALDPKEEKKLRSSTSPELTPGVLLEKERREVEEVRELVRDVAVEVARIAREQGLSPRHSDLLHQLGVKPFASADPKSDAGELLPLSATPFALSAQKGGLEVESPQSNNKSLPSHDENVTPPPSKGSTSKGKGPLPANSATPLDIFLRRPAQFGNAEAISVRQAQLDRHTPWLAEEERQFPSAIKLPKSIGTPNKESIVKSELADSNESPESLLLNSNSTSESISGEVSFSGNEKELTVRSESAVTTRHLERKRQALDLLEDPTSNTGSRLVHSHTVATRPRSGPWDDESPHSPPRSSLRGEPENPTVLSSSPVPTDLRPLELSQSPTPPILLYSSKEPLPLPPNTKALPQIWAKLDEQRLERAALRVEISYMVNACVEEAEAAVASVRRSLQGGPNSENETDKEENGLAWDEASIMAFLSSGDEFGVSEESFSEEEEHLECNTSALACKLGQYPLDDSDSG